MTESAIAASEDERIARATSTVEAAGGVSENCDDHDMIAFRSSRDRARRSPELRLLQRAAGAITKAGYHPAPQVDAESLRRGMVKL
jgi:hypothetical protein